MNKSPDLRFSDFFDPWHLKKISEITKVFDGTHSTPKYVERGIPFYSVEHVTSNQFSKTKFISEDVFNKENKRVKLERGDILMTRIGSVGVPRIIDWDVNASFYVSLALIKKNNSFHSPFLAHSISSVSFQREIWKRTIHVAFPKKINLGEILNCEFLLPSVEEQNKIAEFLSSVDKKIQLLEKKKEQLELYKKGVMQKIFSQEIRFKDDNGNSFQDWESNSLGNLCEITTGKLDANAMVEKGNYRFYTCANNYYQIDKYEFDTDALIVSGNGANVGYIHRYKGKFNAYQRTYVLDDFDDNILYIKYFLNKYLHKRIFREKRDGNTPYITMSTLTEMEIIKPSLLEQNKIANFLSAIDKKIETTSTQIDKTKEFKKGLLQQMFV